MQRIIIVANKSWEVDAAIAAILNLEYQKKIPNAEGIIPQGETVYKDIKIENFNIPWNVNYSESQPRLTFTKGDFRIELWCLNSVMTKNPNPKDNYYYSRASQKAKDFPRILAYSLDPIGLVIAFGTAGVPSEVSKNGGVIIGSNVFPYDSGKETDASKRYECDFEKLVESSIGNAFFDALNLGISKLSSKQYFEIGALSPPNNPNTSFQCIADLDIVAISDMNTTMYNEFKECDAAALKVFRDKKFPQTAYSVETTHSLIRLESKCDKFIFISAITDRLDYFDNEVNSKPLSQNFSASFNGGVFLSWFIPYFFDRLSGLI